MLLRNMIFRLNVEMIDSPKGEYDIFDFVKSDYSVLAGCSYCEAVEKCLDVTAGTALLSSFEQNVTVGLSLCHMALVVEWRASPVVRDSSTPLRYARNDISRTLATGINR